MKAQLLEMESRIRAQHPHWSSEKIRWLAMQATGQLHNARR